MSNNQKMIRQLLLYQNICQTWYHGPDELMKRFKISRRMLQRDLKDLMDAGVIRLTLDKRMRQRDFCALNDIGYNIYYSHKYKAIIFEDDWDYSY